jgi:hypothetical protein
MCPGPQIQAFYDCFGGSAQHIYQDSKNLNRFDHRVNESASKLDNKMIHHVATTDSPTVAIDDSVGHMLVTALPLDDRDRTQFRLTSPTPYLEEKLLIRINANIELARRELYIINVTIPTPGSKATAADLLDRHHHAFIALGGKWRLREFVKVQKADPAAKANLWRADGDSSMYLVADGKMSIRSNAKASTSRIRTRSTNPTDFQQLTTVNFPTQNGVQLLSHHYYRPIDHNFATFDSFYLDTPTHAITFQASEGDRPHSVKPGGRTWMKERGTKKFTYIYVSGPNAATPSITVPQNAVGDFGKFYHLILEYPELEKLLRSSS